jgi:hypothetical protein
MPPGHPAAEMATVRAVVRCSLAGLFAALLD